MMFGDFERLWNTCVEQELVGPGGVPLSEFDVVKFQPKEDITPMEVALLLVMVSRGTTQAGWVNQACVRRDKPPPEWPRVCRHFIKLGKADDVVRQEQTEDRR